MRHTRETLWQKASGWSIGRPCRENRWFCHEAQGAGRGRCRIPRQSSYFFRTARVLVRWRDRNLPLPPFPALSLPLEPDEWTAAPTGPPDGTDMRRRLAIFLPTSVLLAVASA